MEVLLLQAIIFFDMERQVYERDLRLLLLSRLLVPGSAIVLTMLFEYLAIMLTHAVHF